MISKTARNKKLCAKLIRPLVFFDLETTGVDTAKDRIVQFAGIRLEPPGGCAPAVVSTLVNPQTAIPAGATAVHGITDEDVLEAPTFGKVAKHILKFLSGADLAGYNIAQFDVELLVNEFERATYVWEPDYRVIDMMQIQKILYPRTLAGVYKFFTGEEMEGAHDALNDVEATMTVFAHQLPALQLSKGADIGAVLEAYCIPAGQVSYAGKLLRDEDGNLVVNFGKHKGVKLTKCPADYIKWALTNNVFDRLERAAILSSAGGN